MCLSQMGRALSQLGLLWDCTLLLCTDTITLHAGGDLSAVPSVLVLSLFYLGTGTHCHLIKNRIPESLSPWSLLLNEQTCTGLSLLYLQRAVLLIPSCVGLNAVIVLHLAPCWMKMGSTYASSPLHNDGFTWQVSVEEGLGFCSEVLVFPVCQLLEPLELLQDELM